jgi:ABC-type uncharacterized transport system fused permease/ATPase subunit
MSYSEVHRLPIRYRSWFLRRLVKHFNDKNKAYEDAKLGNSSKNKDTSQSDIEKFKMFETQIKSKL